jgi:SseB protein N-terminal domain
MRQMNVSIATDGKTVTPAQAAAPQVGTDPANPSAGGQAGSAVERALAAAVRDASRIGELLDALKSARLWLPLPDDGRPIIRGSAVTLPTVTYLGSDFVPAYSSAELLHELAWPDTPAHPDATVPHAVVQAADLARLLPSSIGIALNAGASESVPVYPQGVAYLAARDDDETAGRISLGPLPASPDFLLAGISSGLRAIPQASSSAAAWLSVQFAGEGLVISVTLEDPADGSVKDAVVAAVQGAAALAPPQESGFPIDVAFAGESEPDYIDQWFAAFGAPFYRR